jgi:hypothetical protein
VDCSGSILMTFRQRKADAFGVEETEESLLLSEVGTRRIAGAYRRPGTAA